MVLLKNRAFLPLSLAGIVFSPAAGAEVVAPLVFRSAETTPLTASSQLAVEPSIQLPQFTEETIVPVDAKSENKSEISNQWKLAIVPPISAIPAPGSVETTASSLLTQPAASAIESRSASGSETVAQAITPGRATRSGSSYFGVGGNIGFIGDSTAVGNGSFVILSKIGLTDKLSFRPAVLFGDNVTFLLPVTYDFSSVGSVGRYSVAPYVGGGLALNADADDTFNLLGTVGVDIPLGSQFTANAALNVTFLNEVSFGLILGVGYNF